MSAQGLMLVGLLWLIVSPVAAIAIGALLRGMAEHDAECNLRRWSGQHPGCEPAEVER